MLKDNKFLLGLVASLGFATASFTANADIVDTFESTADNTFYLLESIEAQLGSGTNTVYEYDMTAAGTSVTPLFQIPETPTQIAKYGSLLYISAGRSLWEYTTAGTRTHIRNLVTDAIDLIVTENHLIVLQGAPDNGIFVYRRTSDLGASLDVGEQVDRTPVPLDPEDFYGISGIFHDSVNARIVVQINSAADNPEAQNSQYLEASFNDADTANPLGILTTIPVNDGGTIPPLDSPDGMSRAIFLDDLQMAIDENGSAVDFAGGADIIFSHANPENARAIDEDLTAEHLVATDGTIDAASDDNSFAYYAMTLDNPCNPIGVGGSRIIRRFKFNRFLMLPRQGWLENKIYYYDTANSIHSIASDGTNQFLFYGEGAGLSVEVIDNTDFSYPFFPWRNDNYSPANANMSNVKQSTSFALNDTNIAMQIDGTCDHYVGFWNTTTNSFYGHTETRWFNAIDGAYVPGLNRIFLAFTDGDNYFIQHFDSVTPESQDETKFSVRDVRSKDTIHKLVAAGSFLVVSKTSAEGTDQVVSYNLSDISSGGITNQELNDVSTINGNTNTDCCSAWTGAVYSDIQKRIYFTTSEFLFYIGFDGSTGAFSGSAVKSIDYGTIHTIPSDNPTLSLNSDETLLFIDAQVYDTSNLQVIDSVNNDADVGIFTNSALYSIDFGASSYQTSTYAGTGSPDLLDDAVSTTLNGTVVGLLPILSGGNVVPLTLATQTNGTLNITINGTSTANVGSGNGTTDDGGGDDSSGGNDGGCAVTNQCVQAPGGGGGGPVDWLLLVGLVGLGARQLRKTA
ncbi:MAG: hypothetical protein R3208_09010 [Ketobacteraceae bacterium]|nr:hypothetical protein [Ketobacteraceae bacterium]